MAARKSGGPGASAPRWSRLEYDERRAQILEAARALFAERPFSAVSTTEIAEAAGVARGLLNHYFGTKRELYLEVMRQLVRTPVPPVVRQSGGIPPDPNLWEASVDDWLDLIEANKDTWLVAIGAGETGRDPQLHRILDEARELTATQVLQALGLDQGEVPPELRAMVRGFGGLAEETTREWLERERITREQARVLLTGALPLLIEELLPAVLAARASKGDRGRRPKPGGKAAAPEG